MTIDEAIPKTIEYCNLIRSLDGAVAIDDLVAGFPRDSDECVVARSVNCGLSIIPLSESDIGMYSDLDDYDLFINSNDLNGEEWVIEDRSNEEAGELILKIAEATGKPRFENVVIVPDYVKKVAQEFDRGHLAKYEINSDA